MHAILIEGASTAYGMDAGDYGGWAAQLHRDAQAGNIETRKDPLAVMNHALPGLGLKFINKYSQLELMRGVCRGSLVRILSTGLNEAKIVSGRQKPLLDLGRFASELGLYANTSRMYDVPVVYVGLQQVDESRTRPVPTTGSIIEDDLLAEYNDLIRQRAAEDGMGFVDVRALTNHLPLVDTLGKDGYHPNALGHELIHAGVVNALTKIPGLL